MLRCIQNFILPIEFINFEIRTADKMLQTPSNRMISKQNFKKYLATEFHSQHFEEKIRADGRGMMQQREVSITKNPLKSCSSAMVRIGNTSVLCGIKCEVSQPSPLKPDEGFMCVNLDCSPLCSPKFKPGAPGEFVQAHTDILNQVFGSVDLKQLCIEAGSKVWCIYADVVCLNYDGSILDAACLALRIALQGLVLPKYPNADASQVPFKLGISPKCTTFGIYNEEVILIDPNSDEESVINGSFSVIADDTGNILCIKKTGVALTFNQMKDCIDVARKRLLEI